MNKITRTLFAIVFNVIYFGWLINGGYERIMDDTLEAKVWTVVGGIICVAALVSIMILNFREK